MTDACKLAIILGKGRGLIAARQIHRGEVITCDHCLRVSDDDWKLIEKTALWNLVYFRELEGTIERLICFGSSTFVNHSRQPNLEKIFQDDSVGTHLLLRANQEIGPGEELSICYTDPHYMGVE